ncbi:hypothetical protein TNCV_334901 [Trichonephila clavipes]|nr:hypothetical protein TNCV_334901 [Trichonephila clavipes]
MGSIEKLTKASPASQQKRRCETPARIAAERRSVEEAWSKIRAKAPTLIHLPSPYRRLVFYGGRGSRREIASAKSAKSVIAQSRPAAKALPDKVRKMTASLRRPDCLQLRSSPPRRRSYSMEALKFQVRLSRSAENVSGFVPFSFMVFYFAILLVSAVSAVAHRPSNFS